MESFTKLMTRMRFFVFSDRRTVTVTPPHTFWSRDLALLTCTRAARVKSGTPIDALVNFHSVTPLRIVEVLILK